MRRAGSEAPLSKRLLKYGAVAVAALAFAFGARAWDAGSRDVALTYQAPAGMLRVTITDSDGDRMRTTEFHGGERAHTVELADGRYTVRLEVEGRGERSRTLEVVGDGAQQVAW